MENDKRLDTNIREYAEGYSVKIAVDEDNGRLTIFALNEGGHNSTWVDLLDVINFYNENKEKIDSLLNNK